MKSVNNFFQLQVGEQVNQVLLMVDKSGEHWMTQSANTNEISPELEDRLEVLNDNFEAILFGLIPGNSIIV